MKNQLETEKKHSILYIIFLFVILLVLVSGYFFITDYHALSYRRPAYQNGMPNVTYVRSWMTFDYINRTFHLPNDYLQKSFNINDPHYPRVSIATVAKENHASLTMFVRNVEQDIQQYTSTTSVPLTN